MTDFTMHIAESRPFAHLADVTVTNGTERVTLGILPRGEGQGEHVALAPVDAVMLAVALLDAARNVEVGTHGSDPQVIYDHAPRARALAILTDHVPPIGD